MPCIQKKTVRAMDFENAGLPRERTVYKSVWGALINVGAQSCDSGFDVLKGANSAASCTYYISVDNNSPQQMTWKYWSFLGREN